MKDNSQEESRMSEKSQISPKKVRCPKKFPQALQEEFCTSVPPLQCGSGVMPSFEWWAKLQK